MFNHILTYRREFQIGVKSGAVGGYFWETGLDFTQSKLKCIEQGVCGGHHTCDGSVSHLHMGGIVDSQ